jgi:hypothetical protein
MSGTCIHMQTSCSSQDSQEKQNQYCMCSKITYKVLITSLYHYGSVDAPPSTFYKMETKESQ